VRCVGRPHPQQSTVSPLKAVPAVLTLDLACKGISPNLIGRPRSGACGSQRESASRRQRQAPRAAGQSHPQQRPAEGREEATIENSEAWRSKGQDGEND
jgi:hypothetical protein